MCIQDDMQHRPEPGREEKERAEQLEKEKKRLEEEAEAAKQKEAQLQKEKEEVEKQRQAAADVHAKEKAAMEQKAKENEEKAKKLQKKMEEEQKKQAELKLKAQKAEQEANLLRAQAAGEQQDYPCPEWLHVYRYTSTGKFLLAIVGGAGQGKSTFINVLRGSDDAKSSAAGECTVEPTPFELPGTNGKVVVFDLPGANTPKFPQRTYIRDMGLRYFDAVIVVTNDRWLEVDDQVVKELDKFKVPAFVVRSKMDQTLSNMRQERDDDSITLDQAMQEARQAVANKSFVAKNRFYMVSSFWIKNKKADAPENAEFMRLTHDLIDQVTEARGQSAYAQVAKNAFNAARANGLITKARGALAVMASALFGA